MNAPLEKSNTQAKISVVGVGKNFTVSGHTMVAIDNIDLNIQANEFVSIVGTSGCGKSTLLNMIGGLDEPTFGDILTDGRPLLVPGVTGASSSNLQPL